MKLICSKANLLKGVNIVSKAVPTRTTMAILECILIDASANEIKLMANDMELGIETIIDGTIEERGIIALDAKIFSEIVRKLPDNDVTIGQMLPLRPSYHVKRPSSISSENQVMIFLTYHMLREMSLLSSHSLPLKRLSDRQFFQLRTMTTIN